ncbi:L-rhamnose mutarotase [Marinococcus luteus]|uniref:L-rhamnose mutarotase n=1 Tax=Marinococcus luteus TaxID=1122204 RepID=UPI002ACC7C0B|nr:L-rhamnose mutarotase [Marinococcus luteus]MDZ5783462.1 L-rhamnose mutarotase [Marinococcus luteus]
MKRLAFIMYVYPEKVEEYIKQHDQLWPEMKEALKQHGASNYSIFLEKETSRLFAYLEIENEERWQQMSWTPINKKWWEAMAPLMETNEDNSPVSTPLEEIFHLD